MSEEKKQDLEENKEKVVVENTESNIQISDDVVAVIAGMAASEVPGVADMAGGFAGGISEVLSGKKNLSKGIKVDIMDKSTKIDVNIIVEYGARIPDVAYEIQKRVKKSVESMTGLNVDEVNVHVQGVSTSREDKKSTKKEEEKKFEEEQSEEKQHAKKSEAKKTESKKTTIKKTPEKKVETKNDKKNTK